MAPAHSRDTAVWWSEKQGAATLLLRRSLGEARDPYGGAPIELLPEVASTDQDKVIFLLQSSHGAIPNHYIICSWQRAHLVRLPLLPVPEVLLPGSMGLLNDSRNGSHHVAHLSVMPNQTGGITQGYFHLWKYTPSSKLPSPKTDLWTHRSVQVTLPLLNCTNWHAHRVIPFNGKYLIWADLNKGILHMNPSDKEAIFHFVGLPTELSSYITRPWRNDRPDMFRSVGCCNDKVPKVKLVNLHIPHRSTTNTVALDIWTLDLENGNWSKDNNVSLSLNCRNLWASYRNNLRRPRTTPLPPWPNSVPIFPFLYNSDILCLTVVGENKRAWLLKIDMKANTLNAIVEYPRYCTHMKPPFLINSSSLTPKSTMILWPLPIYAQS